MHPDRSDTFPIRSGSSLPQPPLLDFPLLKPSAGAPSAQQRGSCENVERIRQQAAAGARCASVSPQRACIAPLVLAPVLIYACAHCARVAVPWLPAGGGTQLAAQALELAQLPYFQTLAAWLSAGGFGLVVWGLEQLGFMLGDATKTPGGWAAGMSAVEAQCLAVCGSTAAHLSRGPDGSGPASQAAQLPLVSLTPADSRESRAHYSGITLLALEGECAGLWGAVACLPAETWVGVEPRGPRRCALAAACPSAATPAALQARAPRRRGRRCWQPAWCPPVGPRAAWGCCRTPTCSRCCSVSPPGAGAARGVGFGDSIRGSLPVLCQPASATHAWLQPLTGLHSCASAPPDLTDAEARIAGAAPLAGSLQAEGHASASCVRKEDSDGRVSLEKQQVVGWVSASAAAACSVAYAAERAVGIQLWEGSHSFRLPDDTASVPGYVPLGNRERPAPANPSDAAALTSELLRVLVRCCALLFACGHSREHGGGHHSVAWDP